MSRTPFILMTVCLAVLEAAAPAQAYRIYNLTGQDLRFDGESCKRCYSGVIKSGDSAACPGDDSGCGGTTYITLNPAGHEECKASTVSPVFTTKYCPIPVSAHGWVEFRPGPSCVVYAADGSVQSSSSNGVTIGGVDAQGQPIPIPLVDHCGIFAKH